MLVLGLCMFAKPLQAQNEFTRTLHQPPALVDRGQPVRLTFDIPSLNPANIQDAFLFYRYDGDISYRQLHATYDGNLYVAELNIGNENARTLEYYFSAELTDGTSVTFPVSSPETEPVRVDIVDRQAESGEAADIDYTILSPEPGSSVTPSDMILAITLFYEPSTVDEATTSFRLLLDDEDVTDRAMASDYFFSFTPDTILPGSHSAALLMATPEDTLTVTRWNFRVLEPGQMVFRGSLGGQFGFEESTSLMPQGQLEVTAQNQELGGIGNDVLRGNARLRGGNREIRYTFNGLLTSQQQKRLQNQNRIGGELYVGDWLELQGGDIYPIMSRLSISGRRVRGINAAVHLADDRIHAEILYGNINRSIPNLYSGVETSILESDGTPVDTSYTLNFASGGTGTFQRTVTGGRLAFGRPETFQWGVNFLQVRDDTNSISNIYDLDDLIASEAGFFNSLDPAFQNDLEANPELLSINGNPQPKDNLIAGSDLQFRLFDDMVRFQSETAISLLNEDISNGVLSDNNSLDINIDQKTSSDLEKWAWLFIINENLSVFPVRYREGSDGTEIESTYFPTSILANQSELTLDLGRNSVRAQYRWIGPNYNSLANSTVRRDIAGLSLSDRFNLLDNRLYVTLGYDYLNDNVSNTKDATTNTESVHANLSWFPIDQFLPRVSLGLRFRSRNNGVELFNPYVREQGLSELYSVRNFTVADGDTLLTPTPWGTNTSQVNSSVSQQFTLLDMIHEASFNYSYVNTRDRLFGFGDTRSSSVNLSLQSRLNMLPLRTRIGLNINKTNTLGGLSDMHIVGFNIGGTLMMMENRLNLYTDITFTRNNMENTILEVFENGTNDPKDDIFREGTEVDRTRNNLIVLRTGARYRLNPRHSFVVNFSYTNVSDQLSGINPPNDHLLQAQYYYRF